jgi:hypothetical protein
MSAAHSSVVPPDEPPLVMVKPARWLKTNPLVLVTDDMAAPLEIELTIILP